MDITHYPMRIDCSPANCDFGKILLTDMYNFHIFLFFNYPLRIIKIDFMIYQQSLR